MLPVVQQEEQSPRSPRGLLGEEWLLPGCALALNSHLISWASLDGGSNDPDGPWKECRMQQYIICAPTREGPLPTPGQEWWESGHPGELGLFWPTTAVLEQVGPRTHLQWGVPSSASRCLNHTHTHTHTHTRARAGRAEWGRGLGSVVSRVWHRVALHK